MSAPNRIEILSVTFFEPTLFPEPWETVFRVSALVGAFLAVTLCMTGLPKWRGRRSKKDD